LKCTLNVIDRFEINLKLSERHLTHSQSHLFDLLPAAAASATIKIAEKEGTLDHLKIVSEKCHVVEDDKGNLIGAMVLHPRKEVSEIEDFHVRGIHTNKEALALLKKKLLEHLEGVETEVLCCSYAIDQE
jgi:hypothetical protein